MSYTSCISLTEESDEAEVSWNANVFSSRFPKTVKAPPEVLLESGFVHHVPEYISKAAKTVINHRP